jgi:hypothetical protein
MIKFLLLPLLVFGACVSEPEQDQASGTVGVVRRYEPIVITVEDNQRIEAICRAISAKEDFLDILVTTVAEYDFTYTQKGCSETEPSSSKDVVTTIERSDSSYIFKSKNGEGFGFPDVETTSRGVMKEICQYQGALTSPIQTSRSGALWFTTFTDSKYCQSDANGICVHLQRGSIMDDLNYSIHTNEWIKFKITNEKRGFFIERRFVSSANCPKGAFEKRAVLK